MTCKLDCIPYQKTGQCRHTLLQGPPESPPELPAEPLVPAAPARRNYAAEAAIDRSAIRRTPTSVLADFGGFTLPAPRPVITCPQSGQPLNDDGYCQQHWTAGYRPDALGKPYRCFARRPNDPTTYATLRHAMAAN